MPEVYLGDGAYASWDGSELTLWTSDGISKTNTIYLDELAIGRLVDLVGVKEEQAD
jgi:hypothetical protein